MSCRSGPMDANAWRKTLIANLTPCIDSVRELNADYGLRPFRVFLVKTRWTGGARGRGVETVVSEEEILPMPKVETLASINMVMMTVGTDENGDVRISEISLKYDENKLMGRGPGGEPLDNAESFRWELQNIARGESWRRSFVVRGVPDFKPGQMQCTVVLARAGQHDRKIDGTP